MAYASKSRYKKRYNTKKQNPGSHRGQSALSDRTEERHQKRDAEIERTAVFILATTEKHKIIPTILSRCQIYDFNRIRVEDGVEYLKYIASQEGAVHWAF